MSTLLSLRTSPDNMALHVRDTASVAALSGILAEWDMKTIAGTAMTDVSGNGNTATFTGTPTITAFGVSFNGTYWADATIAALPGDNFSFFYVAKIFGEGYYAMGSFNNALGPMGHAFRAMPGFTELFASDLNNSSQVGSPMANDKWYSAFANIDKRHGRVRGITQGPGLWAPTLREDNAASTRTRWRIGAAFTTAEAALLPLVSGEIAYCGIFKRVLSEGDIYRLIPYIQSKLTPRGITSFV